VRRPADASCEWNDEDERFRRDCGKAERVGGRAYEDVRGDGASSFFLVIDDWTRCDRKVNLVLGEMRVQRLTVMVLVFVGIEVHVHQRRADGANLHEHGKGGRGQPAKHVVIVVKDSSPGT
jgi:hypothetical protein